MKEDATALNLATTERALDAVDTFALRIGVPTHSQVELAFKRAIDVAAALTIYTVGAPVLAAIALMVKITSRGPVFFRQIRLGKDGKPFVFYKFRTMQHNSDDAVHRNFAQRFINGHMDGDHSRPYKMVRDPRVTLFGAFLRKTSLDELPQFWNVLRGEMSLVGPRPPIAYELAHYQEWHKDRLKAKPGLTGLWQVSGRSMVPFDEMVMLDLHYIANWSLALDLKIILKTFPVLLRGEGAY
jgi:lipopolysaccharide/colanic/teichoic acid biosynthesis glycosyltransferase